MGDFNFCDTDIDKGGGLSGHDKTSLPLWNDLIAHLSMVDPFRDQYPTLGSVEKVVSCEHMSAIIMTGG